MLLIDPADGAIIKDLAFKVREVLDNANVS